MGLITDLDNLEVQTIEQKPLAYLRFKPFANGGCQSHLQSTRIGSNPWLMVEVKVSYSQQE